MGGLNSYLISTDFHESFNRHKISILKHLPPRRCTPSYRRIQPPTDKFIEMLGRKPHPGADAADVFRSQHRANRKIADEVNRAAEHFAAPLDLLSLKASQAQGQPGIAGIGAEPGEVGRLQGEPTVGPFVGAVEGEVLFDQTGSQGHCGHRGGGTQGVIRQPRHGAEAPSQFGHLPQVGLVHGGRVAADAVEQSQILAARVPSRGHRFLDFRLAGHAGGHDHGLAGAGHIADQGQVHYLEGGDLVGRGVETFEQIHRRLVEGRGEHRDTTLASVFEHGPVPFEGGLRPFVQVIELVTIPQATLDHEIRCIAVDSHGVGGIGLQLYGIRAAALSGIDGFQRPF